MFGPGKLGLGELILILGIVLVIFGPTKLPEIGSSMGKAIGSFRSSLNNRDNASKNEDKEL
ncbi:MAG TPA: twin-arginine translocase TatA/TatE family subunit [Tissierellaceae bacterium]|nr:twin-arginine translocase TatA/TatE family subunit [Tissierellaceae bacterium]